MSTLLLLRPLSEADLEEIADLESACTGGWNTAQLKEEMGRRGGWQLLGRLPAKDNIIGYIFGHTVLDEAEIYRLVIAPPCRGQGYGRQMVSLVIDRLRQQGVKNLFLEVRQSNLPALSLYRKAGFQPTGRRRNYYTSPLEDAIVMRRTLSPF